MTRSACRACGEVSGRVVLDLGRQPACDHFPQRDDLRPDPVHPLRMWLCANCGLAQLDDDPTVPEEPRAAEPAALVAQAADAVTRVIDAGWLRPGMTVAEYGSPHGGSWLAELVAHGMRTAGAGEQADAVLDCFGMMHCADQAAALDERVRRLAPDGVLLMQFHSLATILADGQWNALRHGHFAYYSTPALIRMLATAGLAPHAVWRFDLYGGTVLLAATRAGIPARGSADAPSLAGLVTSELRQGVTDPSALARLQVDAARQARALCEWLTARRVDGRSVLGYSAASRAVALLCRAGVGADLLPAIADASPAKWGRRMPGTDIPIVPADELLAAAPDDVLLFLPDLLQEVRAALPGVEAGGGRWTTVDQVTGDAWEVGARGGDA